MQTHTKMNALTYTIELAGINPRRTYSYRSVEQEGRIGCRRCKDYSRAIHLVSLALTQTIYCNFMLLI